MKIYICIIILIVLLLSCSPIKLNESPDDRFTGIWIKTPSLSMPYIRTAHQVMFIFNDSNVYQYIEKVNYTTTWQDAEASYAYFWYIEDDKIYGHNYNLSGSDYFPQSFEFANAGSGLIIYISSTYYNYYSRYSFDPTVPLSEIPGEAYLLPEDYEN